MRLLITREMAKLIREAEAEIMLSAWTCDFYAEHALRFLADEIMLEQRKRESRVVFDPHRVVLAIMPWNYPFWAVFSASSPRQWPPATARS